MNITKDDFKQALANATVENPQNLNIKIENGYMFHERCDDFITNTQYKDAVKKAAKELDAEMGGYEENGAIGIKVER